MEISGREMSTRSEAQRASDDVTNVLQCEQCEDSGHFVVASAFCSNCVDYLCIDCIRQHRRLRGLKDHILLEGTAMPKAKPRTSRGQECLDHPGEILKLFCQSDKSIGCVLCMTESHRNCDGVISISKLAKDIGTSQELIDMKMSAEHQNEIIAAYRKLIDEYRLLNDTWFEQSIEQFEILRTNIMASLERLGQRVHAEARQMMEMNENKLTCLSEALDSMEQELGSIMSDIEVREATRQSNQLFIAIKMNSKHVEENRQRVDQLEEDVRINSFRFEVAPTMKQLMETIDSVGLVKKLSGFLKYSGTLYAEDPEDRRECNISDIVELSPTEIVAADHYNECLKQIDVVKKTTVLRRSLSSLPCGLTVIPGSRIAVTFPTLCQVQYFSTDHNLDPCGVVEVDGSCLAIRSSGSKLFVSFYKPGKIQMIDLKGTVLTSFSLDTTGSQLFQKPMYLSLSRDERSIYVSDCQKNTVTCLDTDGSVQWVYIDPRLCCPNGLTPVVDGSLYISSGKTDSIHVVSARGVKLNEIQVARFKMSRPQAICCSQEQGLLYASNGKTAPDLSQFIKKLSIQ